MVMTRKKLKTIYLLTFILWSVVLFFFVPVSEMQDAGFSRNPYFLWSVWIFSAFTFVYVHLFITRLIFFNFLLTTTSFLFYGAGSFLTNKLIHIMPDQASRLR